MERAAALRLDYFLDFWQMERIGTLRGHLDRAMQLAGDQHTRLRIGLFAQVLYYTAFDTSATRAYQQWRLSQTKNDWLYFQKYVLRRQAFLEGLSPFSGVLIDRSVPLRGGGHYEVKMRWRASSGAALRVRLVHASSWVLRPELPDTWTETTRRVTLPDGRERLHLYLYIYTDPETSLSSQIALDWIAIRQCTALDVSDK